MSNKDTRLLEEYERLRPMHASNAATHRALMLRYDLSSIDSVRKRIARARKQRDRKAQPARPSNVVGIITAAPLPDVDLIDPVIDDMPEIQRRLAELKRLPRMVRYLKVSDEHIDDHDERALRMNVAIARWFNPDVLVFGGDTHDLAALGRYDKDRREGKRDALKAIRKDWLNYAHAMIDATPNAVRIFEWGNHNERQEAYANANWEAGDTLEEAYAALCRCEGEILLTGGKQELFIGPLLVHHGERFGKNAAKNSLENDFGGAQPKDQGHTHDVQMVVKRVKLPNRDKWVVVTSLVAGFAGRNPPQYKSRRNDQIRWIHSLSYGHINLRGTDVHLYPVIMHEREDNSLVAAVGGQVFEVPAAVSLVARAA